MARQTGIIKIEGLLDGLSFYNSKFGPIVRRKGGADKKRIAKDPAFVNVRKHNKEFGDCAKAGRTLRQAVAGLVPKTKDHLRVGVINQLMFQIKNCDTTSAKGERTADKGLVTAAGQELIRGFDINRNAFLKDVLFEKAVVNTSNGTISITGFRPKEHLKIAKGATHVQLQGAWIKIDLGNKCFETQVSPVTTFLLNTGITNLNLAIDTAPAMPGSDLFILKIGFLQEVNGILYDLKDGVSNILNVLEVR